ncbi:hypothetical protein C8J56DRAFT_904935 [Mycena floridula]|nr:hypothetical protein C8J56DRAFT_904935 [Mycena floridula]
MTGAAQDLRQGCTPFVHARRTTGKEKWYVLPSGPNAGIYQNCSYTSNIPGQKYSSSDHAARAGKSAVHFLSPNLTLNKFYVPALGFWLLKSFAHRPSQRKDFNGYGWLLWSEYKYEFAGYLRPLKFEEFQAMLTRDRHNPYQLANRYHKGYRYFLEPDPTESEFNVWRRVLFAVLTELECLGQDSPASENTKVMILFPQDIQYIQGGYFTEVKFRISGYNAWNDVLLIHLITVMIATDGDWDQPPSASKKKATKSAKPGPVLLTDTNSAKAGISEPAGKAKKKHGNKGNFEGEELALLELWFVKYKASEHKRQGFWADFFKAWWSAFPWREKGKDNGQMMTNLEEVEMTSMPTLEQGAPSAASLAMAPELTMPDQDVKAKTAFMNEEYKFYMKMPEHSQKVADAFKDKFPAEPEVEDDGDEQPEDDDEGDEDEEKEKPLTPQQQAKRLALLRCVRLARELYDTEPESVQKSVKKARDDEFDDHMLKHEMFLKASLCDNEDREAMPLLNGLYRYTGLYFTLVGGAPPRDKDDLDAEWTSVSLHAGKTSGDSPKTFSEWSPVKYQEEWMSFYVKFLWEAFNLKSSPTEGTSKTNKDAAALGAVGAPDTIAPLDVIAPVNIDAGLELGSGKKRRRSTGK